jgi:glycerol kinase
LPIDPYFSATKIEWLHKHNGDVQQAAKSGQLRIGTVDSWIAYKASGGEAHITDPSNASRTMLSDTRAGTWSSELCELFGVDPGWLPEIVDSSGVLAQTDPSSLAGISAPISGIAGDQQSALFGQACFSPGMAKATYGTGAFVLVNAGSDAPPTTDALLSTAAWRLSGDEACFALEGSVFTAGASIQWLRDGLKIIDNAQEIEALANSVTDSGGVTMVPAFAGLGAPFWDANARGSLLGLTRGTGRGHIAQATLEAIAFRVRQNVAAMTSEGSAVHELRVDGGMAHNDTFLQLQADVLHLPVTRPTNIETTSLGAAYLAALGAGLADSPNDLAQSWGVDRVFEPNTARHEQLADSFARFESAVEATRAVGS